MISASAVIGSNFGDEGKGLIVDYLASKYERPLVIRTGSGFQVSHTVNTPESNSHIFHSFSSGSFVGADTLLDSDVVIEPMTFMKEHSEFIKKFGIRPTIYADKNCRITHPADIIVNQLLEKSRNNRHGSCGIGFGETIERYTQYEEGDGVNNEIIYDDIMFNWLPKRLRQLNLEIEFYENFVDKIQNIKSDYLDALDYFWNNVLDRKEIETNKYDHVIFEGHQGLMLDSEYGFFPHVTRSRTGLTGRMLYIYRNSLKLENVYYVTRSYMTRHGNGPLLNEIDAYPESMYYSDGRPYWLKYIPKFSETTNLLNEHQGRFRIGFLDIPTMIFFMRRDINVYPNSRLNYRLVTTCMDQLNNSIIPLSYTKSIDVNEYKRLMSKDIPFKFLFSYGNTRNHIREM